MSGLSIDRQGAVDRIAKRQHLSAVQLVVQLTRAALFRGATRIDIRSTRTQLTITDNGSPPTDDELACLEAAYHGDDRSALHALKTLEAQHGLALLTTCMTNKAVTLRGPAAFSATSERFVRDPAGTRAAVRLDVRRKRESARGEKNELQFYCHAVDADLTYNGRAVKQRPFAQGPFPDALASLVATRPDSTTFVGVVADGTQRRIRFFQNGVYFGVRQRHTDDEVPLECVFNDATRRYSPNFRASVSRASDAIEQTLPQVLAQLAGRLDELNPSDTARLTRLLLRAAPRGWAGPVQHAKVFESTTPGVRFSPQELLALVGRRGFLPYARQDSAAPPAPLPVFAPLAARRLAERLGVKARLFRSRTAPALTSPPRPRAPSDGRTALTQALARRGLQLHIVPGERTIVREADTLHVGDASGALTCAENLAPSSSGAAEAAADMLIRQA